MDEPVKSVIEIAEEKKAVEEARLKAQEQFDPTKHGVGTRPMMEPESVKELNKKFQQLVEYVQEKVFSLQDRIAELEKKVE